MLSHAYCNDVRFRVAVMMLTSANPIISKNAGLVRAIAIDLQYHYRTDKAKCLLIDLS